MKIGLNNFYNGHRWTPFDICWSTFHTGVIIRPLESFKCCWVNMRNRVKLFQWILWLPAHPLSGHFLVAILMENAHYTCQLSQLNHDSCICICGCWLSDFRLSPHQLMNLSELDQSCTSVRTKQHYGSNCWVTLLTLPTGGGD